MRAAVYARISKDPEEQRAGVDRQAERGQKIALERGYTVVAVEADNDASGFREATRPGFAQLRDLMQHGDVEVVIAQHQDRFARNVATFRAFADLAVEHDVRLETWAGPLDVTSAAGRFTSTVQSAVDEHYSALIGEKATAALAQRRSAGLPNGGGHRPFGYADEVAADGKRRRSMKLNPVEADLVQEAARRVIEGESLSSIVRDWNRRQIATTTGRRWQAQPLHRILTHPRIAGIVTHHGAEVGPAQWEPVLDRVTFEQVRALLTTRTRRGPDSVDLRYWVRGLVFCGRCGSRLTTATTAAGGRRLYRCPSPGSANTAPGCGGLSIGADALEGHVEGWIMDQLSEYRAALGVPADGRTADEVAADLADLDRREHDIGEGLATGALTVAVASIAVDGIRSERDRLRALLAAPAAPTALPDNLVDLWPLMLPAERRQVARVLIERITVGPVVVRGPRFDPSRVEIIPA